MSNLEKNEAFDKANKTMNLGLKTLTILISFFFCALVLISLLIAMIAGHRPDSWVLNNASINLLFLTAILAVIVWFFITIKLAFQEKYLYANGLAIAVIGLFGISQIWYVIKTALGIQF